MGQPADAAGQPVAYVNGKRYNLPTGRAEATLLQWLRGEPCEEGQKIILLQRPCLGLAPLHCRMPTSSCCCLSTCCIFSRLHERKPLHLLCISLTVCAHCRARPHRHQAGLRGGWLRRLHSHGVQLPG